jgi:hypothetical protein
VQGNDSAAATSSSREHKLEEEPAMSVSEEGVRLHVVRLFNRSAAWSVSVHWRRRMITMWRSACLLCTASDGDGGRRAE